MFRDVPAELLAAASVDLTTLLSGGIGAALVAGGVAIYQTRANERGRDATAQKDEAEAESVTVKTGRDMVEWLRGQVKQMIEENEELHERLTAALDKLEEANAKIARQDREIDELRGTRPGGG